MEAHNRKSKKVSMRPKSGLQEVNAPATNQGTSFMPGDPDPPYNPRNRAFDAMSERGRGWGQTLMFAPWNRPAGMGPDAAPSFSTTTVALLLIFVSCLTYGWVITVAIDNMLAEGAGIFTQSLFLGTVASLLFALTMLWSWEPLLKTHVFWGILTAQVGTFDLGLLPWLLVSIFQLGGYAAGGAIAGAIGLQQVASPSVMPVANTSGYVLYWFGGAMIIFAYIMAQKFKKEYDGDEMDGPRDRRAILIGALAVFVFTATFRRTGPGAGLYYFDTAPYLAGLVASGLGDVTADNVTDWAFYLFVPLASMTLALILYYGLDIGRSVSDTYDGRAAAMGRKAEYH